MEEEKAYALKRAELMDGIVEEIKGSLPVDCSRGCAYCCYGVTLWIRRSEAILMWSFLNDLPIRERKRLAKSLREYERVYTEEARKVNYTPSQPIPEALLDTDKLGIIGGLGMNEVPCPFLDTQTKECLIYEARPGMCRLTLFKDREVCRRDWENPLSFLWKNEILPFIEGVKDRFYKRWGSALRDLAREFPRIDVEDMEGRVAFVTYWIRFDPVKKTFKLRA